MNKKQIINNLKLLEDDCQAWIDNLETDDYTSPWEIYDVGNWQCMVETIQETVKFLKKAK